NSVIITDANKVSYIKKIIEAGFDEDIWNYFAESNPTLVTKLSYARILDAKQKIIDELALRLNTGGFAETSGDDSWQKWIHKNNWLFGVNYKKPIEKVKINITGIMPDYLFPTLDGFVDILEIKLPEDDVISKDTNHRGSWKWTAKTNEAIGQVVNYLGEIDRLRFEIEKDVKDQYKYEISLLKPRTYILIGDNTSWNVNKKDGLRKMNHALHGIEIITYNDLLDRGNQAVNNIKEEI
ncbi:Shedu anti-phage system protein SduA domain-containing protein, partial [Patescibacteria group bacterium]